MAQGGRKGHGCLVTLLALLVAAILVAWGLGIFDRALYLVELDQQTAELPTDAEAASSSGQGVNGERVPYYAYSQLNDDDKEKYRIVLDAIVSREERAYPSDDMDDLTRIRDCVFADRPELFYANGIAMHTSSNLGTGMVTKVSISAEYVYSKEEAAAIERQVQEAARECLAGIPEGADDYAKAKYLYEYLANTVSYERIEANLEAGSGASPDQTVEGALVYRRAVCSGYASAYQYLLQELGIPCTYIAGEARGENHAWCLVKLDGAFYYVDPTWGDPQFAGEGEGETFSREGLVNYDYLCITTAELEADHLVQVPFGVPSCTATADNYYVREGLLFAQFDGQRLGELANDALERDESLQFRCADDEVYGAFSDFIANGGLSESLTVSGFWYSHSDAMRSFLISTL